MSTSTTTTDSTTTNQNIETAAFLAFYDALYAADDMGKDVSDFSSESAEFLECFANQRVSLPYSAELDTIREALTTTEGGCTIKRETQQIRNDLARRRAFYRAAQAFLNDPGTWAALDAQDTLPDMEAIAAQMRAEGIALHDDSTKEVTQ